MSLTDFIQKCLSSPILLAMTILVLGVMFFNGVTDSTNAIATCIATRAISPKKAVLMSAVFNMIGVAVMTMISAQVTETISKLVNLDCDGVSSRDAGLALCGALVSIIVWSAGAVKLGMPTSESHELVAGLVGAAVALRGTFTGSVNVSELLKVVFGLVFSIVIGFALGFLFTKIVVLIFRKTDRRKTTGFFRGAQIFGGAAMSFMHGAQDGQKFIGVMILGMCVSEGGSAADIKPTLWMMLICSLVMALGTASGGYKIIKSVGLDMVKLEAYQGFSADMAGAVCLLLSSLLGLPVSTTHTKTTAIMGVGATKRVSAINFGVVKDMAMTWVLVFPCCALVGFLITKLLLYIF